MIAGDAADAADVRRPRSSTRSTARCATPSTSARSPTTEPASWSRRSSPRCDAVAARLGRTPSSTSNAIAGAGRPTMLLRDAHERVDGSLDQLSARQRLGTEWEWERSPEVSLVIVDDVDRRRRARQPVQPAVRGVGDHGRRRGVRALLLERSNAPFVGNGFTRWVDGQYALDRPELGLANWQGGRLLGRGAILSGDSVHTDPLRGRHHRHDHPSVTTCHVGAWHRRDKCGRGSLGAWRASVAYGRVRWQQTDDGTSSSRCLLGRPAEQRRTALARPHVRAADVLAERAPPPTLPLVAAVGAMVVLTASLIASKFCSKRSCDSSGR